MGPVYDCYDIGIEIVRTQSTDSHRNLRHFDFPRLTKHEAHTRKSENTSTVWQIAVIIPKMS